jgi:hypothetical protein
MTPSEYHYALQLLDSALDLLAQPDRKPAVVGRHLRALSLELDVWRACDGQPKPDRRRN